VSNNSSAKPQAPTKTDHKHAKDRFKLLPVLLEALDQIRATQTRT